MPPLYFFIIQYIHLEYDKMLSLDIEEVTKWRPEVGDINHSTIPDDRVRETIILYYHANN